MLWHFFLLLILLPQFRIPYKACWPLFLSGDSYLFLSGDLMVLDVHGPKFSLGPALFSSICPFPIAYSESPTESTLSLPNTSYLIFHLYFLFLLVASVSSSANSKCHPSISQIPPCSHCPHCCQPCSEPHQHCYDNFNSYLVSSYLLVLFLSYFIHCWQIYFHMFRNTILTILLQSQLSLCTA